MLVKSELNNIEALVFKALTDSDIVHNEFIPINNVLKEFYDMKEEIKNYNDKQTIYKTIMSYYLKCRKNTESKNPKVVRAKSGRIILLPKCEVCDSKKLKSIKEQEASELLSRLGIKTPLNKIPLLGPLLF